MTSEKFRRAEEIISQMEQTQVDPAILNCCMYFSDPLYGFLLTLLNLRVQGKAQITQHGIFIRGDICSEVEVLIADAMRSYCMDAQAMNVHGIFYGWEAMSSILSSTYRDGMFTKMIFTDFHRMLCSVFASGHVKHKTEALKQKIPYLDRVLLIKYFQKRKATSYYDLFLTPELQYRDLVSAAVSCTTIITDMEKKETTGLSEFFRFLHHQQIAVKFTP